MTALRDYLVDIVYYVTTAWDYARNVVDVIIVAFVLYWVYAFLAKTRAIQLLKGMVIIALAFVLAIVLRLDTLGWLIKSIIPSVVIAVIILFQPELRRLITQFGQRNWLSTASVTETLPLDEIVNALSNMAADHIGSLIVIERNTGLKSYAETGVAVDAVISEEFIRTVFHPLTPLHDGALIVIDGRIAGAACYLPLSDSKQLKKHHGARHRAALGIAEETDALVLVTSEETGTISIMVNGRMFSKIRVQDLKNMILFFMNPKTAYEEQYAIK